MFSRKQQLTLCAMALTLGCSIHSRKRRSYMREYYKNEELKELETAFPPAKTPEEEPVIPKPEIFQGVCGSAAEHGALPTTAECAVHLQLLEKFVVLKQKVLTSNAIDRAFGIKPTEKLVTYRGKREVQPDPTFKDRRAVKWPIFIRLSAARFLTWWESCLSKPAALESVVKISESSLPPLDVLMIWHALLLSSEKYVAFCQTTGREDMLQVEYPWSLVHRSLDDKDHSLKLQTQAQDIFNKYVGEVGLFESLACHKDHPDPLRDAFQSLVSSKGISPLSVAYPGLRGTPFSDQDWLEVDQLTIAVQEQATFAELMTNLLWLRSPAAEGTLRRSLVRYERFMSLCKEHPETTFVPAVDITLLWHTHLCSPLRYTEYCQQHVGRVINYSQSKVIESSIEDTGRIYELRFEEEYSPCLCWNCEALKSQIEGLGIEEPLEYERIADDVNVEVRYYTAVEVARRKGAPLPFRTPTKSS